MKTKTKIIFTSMFAASALISAVMSAAWFSPVEREVGKTPVASPFKGNYAFDAFADDAEATTPDYSITKTRTMTSRDKRYKLLATAFDLNKLNGTSYEVGYTVNGTDYASNYYYDSITVQAGEETVTYQPEDIFGNAYEDTETENWELIVYEIEDYRLLNQYSYQPFIHKLDENKEVVAAESTVGGQYSPSGISVLSQKSYDELKAAPGTWGYNTNGVPGLSSQVMAANTQSGIVTYAFRAMTASKQYYLRYQPETGIGEKYQINFTATINTNAVSVAAKRDGYTEKHYSFTANEPFRVSYDSDTPTGNNANKAFFLQLTAPADVSGITEETPVVVTIMNVSVTPVTDYLTEGLHGTVGENKGTWFYYNYKPGANATAGVDYSFATPITTPDGNVILSYDLMTQNASNQHTYQLRFQPNVVDVLNMAYVISFDATLNQSGRVQYTKNGFTQGSVSYEGGETQHIVYKADLSGTNPSFMVSIVPSSYGNVTAETPFTLTLSNIEIIEAEREITYGNKGTTIGGAGNWYYLCDGTAETHYSLVGKAFETNEDGAVLALSKTTSGKQNYLRYQPTFSVGTSYTITFTARFSRTATGGISIGNDGSKHWVSYNTIKNEEFTVTYTDTVQSGEPIQIRINVFDASAADPIILLISDVVITAA